jgi:hypothetical protein
MKYKIIFFLILILFPISVIAVEPLNNKYGIHLAQPYPEAIKEAADLVNSRGGKWGYVTVVIQENDRDKSKWQGIFNQMREQNLIPIVRLATSAEGENWRRPEKKDVKGWVDFLNSLNWVVKNRYVVLFNEPNHGSEWGGEVDTKSYANVVFEFAKSLKEKNKDFFVMISGFDASAPSWMPGMESEETFLREISNFQFLIFNYIDGWASHSYPNPGFAGSPYATGRETVRAYEWELELLKELGVKKELPVFITETGWKRGSEQTVADYLQTVYEQVWGPDDRVMAVTPFVLDYQSDPFLEFSWKLPTEKATKEREFYQQYFTVQSLVKIKGEPEQIEKGEIKFSLPKELVIQSKYDFKITLKNQGQSIWDKDNDYQLVLNSSTGNKPDYLFEDLKDIKPFEEKDIYLTFKTNENLGERNIKLILQKNNKNIFKSIDWKFNILPLPSLKFETNFFPWGKGKGEDYELQIFDVDDRLVFKKKNLSVKQGVGELKNIQNITLNDLYRVVILKPYHLPRQQFIVFKKDNNLIKFKALLPFDLNKDGKLSWDDIKYLFFHKTSADVQGRG